MNSKSKILCTALKDALENKSWKNQMPVLDYSNVFDYFPPYTVKDSREEGTLYAVGLEVVKSKYTNLPDKLYYSYLDFNYRRISYKEEINPTPAQKAAFVKHIENMLDNSTVFPFKNILSKDIITVANLQHGLSLMAYDLYQPMAFQHKTPPSTFKAATASIIKQCPTMLYDQPHKIFSYYPLEFILCIPYFTIPREMPWLPGDKKFSFVDVYLPDSMGKQFRSIDLPTISHAISIMFKDDEKVKNVAHRMFERARIVGGLQDEDPPENFQDFMLARDRARRFIQHHYDENIVAMMNINDAILEANRREQEAREKKLLGAAQVLIDKAKQAHLEEFGK